MRTLYLSDAGRRLHSAKREGVRRFAVLAQVCQMMKMTAVMPARDLTHSRPEAPFCSIPP
jgi:hypothetical protein